MPDIRCREFSDFLSTKKDHYPYSDRYIAEVHDSPDKTGRTEREHMVVWFRANETKDRVPNVGVSVVSPNARRTAIA